MSFKTPRKKVVPNLYLLLREQTDLRNFLRGQESIQSTFWNFLIQAFAVAQTNKQISFRDLLRFLETQTNCVTSHPWLRTVIFDRPKSAFVLTILKRVFTKTSENPLFQLTIQASWTRAKLRGKDDIVKTICKRKNDGGLDVALNICGPCLSTRAPPCANLQHSVNPKTVQTYKTYKTDETYLSITPENIPIMFQL